MRSTSGNRQLYLSRLSYKLGKIVTFTLNDRFLLYCMDEKNYVFQTAFATKGSESLQRGTAEEDIVITAFISSNTGELVKRDLSGFLELKTIF